MITSKDTISNSIIDVLEQSFNKMSADLSKNLVKLLLPPCEKDNGSDEKHEKHVVYVDTKGDTEEHFNARAWNDIVKTKITPSLRPI